MLNKTITEYQNTFNDITDKDRTAKYITFSNYQVNKVTSFDLESFLAIVGKVYSPPEYGNNLIHSVQSSQIYNNKNINTPAYIWYSHANQLLSSPYLQSSRNEKRLSEEIVERYSLSEKVERIYFNQISYFINIDIILSVSTISDNEWGKFFDSEKELLDISNLPINFTYHFNNNFQTYPENVLIFEK